ncbi:MAG: tRNA lysidine(34) synthetase TilS [Deltaproteobacteria bacterium]|nr:tRNA lysidine(34) synthetase TilS [Deltaproteobacteria bacterium]
MDLPGRFRAELEREESLPRGARVLVAVSGGGDSVALLRLLAALAPERELRLEVAAVDHRTRPGTADEVRFVAELAGGLGLPFRPLVLAEDGAGRNEDALRRERLRALTSAARDGGASRIATGHQADDAAETVLMRLLRGAGLDGLGGIRPRHGPLFRPLLGFRRAELRDWLRGEGFRWLDDPSNDDVRRLRARVRHLLLPALRAASPDLAGELTGTAGALRALLQPLDAWDAAWLDRHARQVPAGGVALPVEALRGEPEVVQGRLVRRAVERLGVARSRLGRSCLAGVAEAVARDGSAAVVPLPGGWVARRRGAWLELRPAEADGPAGERGGVGGGNVA